MGLGVSESTLREWLSTFNCERHFDAQGSEKLSPKGVDFLRMVKSLRDVDRSCESIVRLLGASSAEPPADAEDSQAVEDPEYFLDELDLLEDLPSAASDLEQVESLKAELKDLHAAPATRKPFWKFW